MLIKKPADIHSSEITDRKVYQRRREFLRLAGVLAASPLMLSPAVEAGQKLAGVRKSAFRVDDKLTDYKYITSYNNFYEFGTDKSDPAKNSKNFRSVPWTVTVDGEVKRPARYQIEDLLKHHPLEERVYRLRCVEAWSMVIPWVGFPLADLVKRVEPTSRAKYVEFTTLHDPA
ncbi:MAG TPA: protein-methionine-sulfoxide reductase catalytic subunit MsrP, partial [Burkholderiales bacterium]|nr:protein-methionine-sulfoxide reductase catalytic subunit MsrP [Burkholderiales bacterium]